MHGDRLDEVISRVASLFPFLSSVDGGETLVTRETTCHRRAPFLANKTLSWTISCSFVQSLDVGMRTLAWGVRNCYCYYRLWSGASSFLADPRSVYSIRSKMCPDVSKIFL